MRGRNSGESNTPGWTVRVIPNKFPALQIEGDLDRHGEGMFDKMNGIGAHEVVVETPEHDARWWDLSAEHLLGRTVLMVTHDPAEAARLGDAIHILSETGLTDFAPPKGGPPRPVDDTETLAAQGRLLALLRATA